MAKQLEGQAQTTATSPQFGSPSFRDRAAIFSTALDDPAKALQMRRQFMPAPAAAAPAPGMGLLDAQPAINSAIANMTGQGAGVGKSLPSLLAAEGHPLPPPGTGVPEMNAAVHSLMAPSLVQPPMPAPAPLTPAQGPSVSAPMPAKPVFFNPGHTVTSGPDPMAPPQPPVSAPMAPQPSPQDVMASIRARIAAMHPGGMPRVAMY